MILQIILIILGVVVLLGFVPIKICFSYNQVAVIKVKLLFITVFKFDQSKPKKPKNKKVKKDKAYEEQKAAPEPAKKKRKKKSEIKETIKTVFELLGCSKFMGKMLIKSLSIKKIDFFIDVASQDFYKTSMAYYKILAAVNGGYNLLKQYKKFGFKRLYVTSNYVSEKTKLTFSCVVNIVPFFLVIGVVHMLFKFLALKLGEKEEQNKPSV